MIKIEIEAENALEARKELQALLFGGDPVIKAGALKLELPEKEEANRFAQAEENDASVGKTEEPKKDEPKTRKRRTKAEIDVEKKAAQEPEPATEEPVSNEKAPEIHEEPEEVLNPVTEPAAKPGAKKITIHDLRQLSVTKGTPKKPAIANLLQSKYGVQTFPQIDESLYPELYADIEAL